MAAWPPVAGGQGKRIKTLTDHGHRIFVEEFVYRKKFTG
jgi:hypothetical protein